MSAILAISVGNSRTQLGRFEEGSAEIVASECIPNSQVELIVERAAHHFEALVDETAVVALASVNDSMAHGLVARLEGRLATSITRIGRDLSAPISTRLDPRTQTGIDRLLCATAAYRVLKQACVVVDCGTAITVDFVDGEGTYHGGAIAPGAQLQLDALHDGTDALPRVAFAVPDKDSFGRNTEQAMLQGVYQGIRGLVHRLVEQYAEAQGAFPVVVATGGDAATILEHEECVDRIVPDLVLMGIAAAVEAGLVDEGTDEE
ncbi:MAG: type III pantothenate kinase [Phycisphaerales bacterium]|nr:type III pantothenate kinase [Phycisphaerales bacterium]